MISGPLIGAVIGYFTNLIAVKMLFYPKKEIRIFGKKLPFTPGAIPKGQPRLAASVGNVVENHLLTKETIESKLLSEDAKNRVVNTVLDKLSGNIQDELCALTGIDSETYVQKKSDFSKSVGELVVKSIKENDVTGKLLNEISNDFTQRVDGTALKLLINDKTVNAILQPMKSKLDRLIDEHGVEYIKPVVEKKISEVDSGTGMEFVGRFEFDEPKVREFVLTEYEKLVSRYADELIKKLNISQMVEDKINAMSIDELEHLVLVVMKKELNMIVSLGALIGFVLGMVNLLLR